MKRWCGLLLILALTGCSTIGDTVDALNPFASKQPKVKRAALEPIQASSAIKTLWQVNVGAAGEFAFTPAIVGKTVFAAAKDGSLFRFDEGRQTWRVSAGQPLSGGVGADGKIVVVGTQKGEVLAFDASNGKEIWKARASSEILAPPVIGDGLAVVRAGDARIYGFEAADGKRRWMFQRSTPALTLRSQVGVVLTERAAYAGLPGGKLAAIGTANGALLWEGAVAFPKGTTELERIAEVTSLPVVAGRMVCAVAFQGRVACFDAASGNGVWSRDISGRAGLDMDDRYVMVSDDKGVIHGLDRDGRGSLWKQTALTGRDPSRPLIVGNRVVVADVEGVVHVLRRDDGGFAARATTDGSPVIADPQEIPGGFVVQTRNGGLFAFALE